RRAPLRFAPAQGFTSALQEIDSPCVFHLHGALLPEWSAAARSLRAKRIPWVITPHGSWTKAALERSPRRKRAFLSLFDRSLAEQALAVQVNGPAEQADARELFPKARVLVVPNGQALLAAPPRREAGDKEGPRFVFCGRLDTGHKGLDLLIDGFCEHVSRGGAGELVLIGDGEDRAALEARAERAGPRIRFLGPLFGQEKLSQIGAASLFIHSSRHEGMPMAVLEAAALGRPLALSQGTNLLEAFASADACLPLSPNDATTIAGVLARASELEAQGALSVIGERARELVQRDYTWEAAARTLEAEAYRQARQPEGAAA
ncbi:MAG: glycosyltransferase, partial [Planctomycetota bacterium]